MAFNRAPREVKEAIWKFTLPDDEPEVCIMWPLRSQGFSQIIGPFLVDTAFPVLMHVCREWRAFTLPPPSGVRFRRSRLTGCQVPYRHYRPEMDALFVSAANAMFTLQAMAKDSRRGDVAAAVPNPGFWLTLRHLAVEPPVFGEAHEWLPELVFRYSPDLRKVSVVFPSLRKPRWEFLHPPSRRCKLRRIDEAGDGEKKSNNVSIQEHARTTLLWLGRVLSSKWRDDLRARQEHSHEDLAGIYEGTAWYRNEEKPCLVYEAASFVQFRRLGDGLKLWEEGCEDRTRAALKDGGRELNSHGNSHRNPEIWRVNDDAEFTS